MKRIIGICILTLALLAFVVTPVLAAPANLPATTPCVAHCATKMGGQHVANCAQMMDKGVSMCAKMTHSECM
jgi:hypothetical protein